MSWGDCGRGASSLDSQDETIPSTRYFDVASSRAFTCLLWISNSFKPLKAINNKNLAEEKVINYFCIGSYFTVKIGLLCTNFCNDLIVILRSFHFFYPKRSWWFKSQVFLFTIIVRENLYFITENKTIYVCCCLWCFLCSIEQQVVLNRKGVKGKLVCQSLSSNEYKLCRVSKNEEADVTKSLWRAVSDVVMEWMSGFLQVALDTQGFLSTNKPLTRTRARVVLRYQGQNNNGTWPTTTGCEIHSQTPYPRYIRGYSTGELRSDRGGN